MPSDRIEEALWAIRHKPVLSTTFERLRLTREADDRVQGKPQPHQLSEGLAYLLDRVSLPVEPHDLLLGRVDDRELDADEEARFQETTQRWDGRGTPGWMPDSGHESFDWARLIDVGLPGLQAFAESEIARRTAAGERGPHLDWLVCAASVYESHRCYARRYAAAARDAGLHAQAQRCAAIADAAPATFAEALQLIWLVAQVYCTMLARNPTLTLGRLDHLLLHLYRSDLDAGRLNREEAGELIEDFYAKNTLILGRGEHQMDDGKGHATGWARNLAYDAPQYLLLAGRVPDGSPATNELTEVFVDRIVPEFENPVIVLRCTCDFPAGLWRRACEKVRANASILLYNDEVAIPAHRRLGVPEELAVDYSLYGCNWPTHAGQPRPAHVHRLVLPPLFLEALGRVDDAATMDDLYGEFERAVQQHLAEVYEGRREWRAGCDARAPGLLSVDDCFLNGPVAQARDWRIDPEPLAALTIGVMGLATAVDSFAAVQHAAFGPGGVSLAALRSAVAADFEGQEAVRQCCLRAPKFGQNDPAADAHAVRVVQLTSDVIERMSNQAPGGPFPTLVALTSDMGHRGQGSILGATPDGRLAGEPLSENMGPSPGSCTDGLSSMLQSVAKLPFDRVQSGPLNVRIDPRTVEGEEGLDRLAAALRTFFDLGGLQAQLSLANAEQLRGAQENPEAHRDLMVRITGYSAVFVDMCPRAQDEFIRRAEMAVG